MTDLRKTAESLARRGVQALSCDEAELADAIHKALEAAQVDALKEAAAWTDQVHGAAHGIRALKSTPQGEPK